MIKAEDLKLLAEAMGKEDVSMEVNHTKYVSIWDSGEGGFIGFRPHKDKAQAFEVLEWLLDRADFRRHHNLDFIMYRDANLFTLPEAITLAAIALAKEAK